MFPGPYRKKTPKLSERMKLFIHYGVIGAPFWDICCDHGHVGIGALESKKFSQVHFVDQLPHIMQRLSTTLLDLGLEESLYFLHDLKGEEIDTTVSGTCLIAGVGGLTITKILQSLLIKNFLRADRLILSPHTDEKSLNAFTSTPAFSELYVLHDKFLIPVGKKMKTLYLYDRKNS